MLCGAIRYVVNTTRRPGCCFCGNSVRAANEVVSYRGDRPIGGDPDPDVLSRAARRSARWHDEPTRSPITPVDQAGHGPHPKGIEHFFMDGFVKSHTLKLAP